MNTPLINIIVAIGENRAIGKNNRLLWHIPEDLQRFKKLTSGHPVIMGRKTFESIGRPLPNRTNIVVTHDKNFTAEGIIITHSLKEAIEKAKEYDQSEIFIIGGGNIYEQAIPLADKLYLTIVHKKVEADTFFPDYSAFTKKISQKQGESNGYKYTFFTLTK